MNAFITVAYAALTTILMSMIAMVDFDSWQRCFGDSRHLVTAFNNVWTGAGLEWTDCEEGRDNRGRVSDDNTELTDTCEAISLNKTASKQVHWSTEGHLDWQRILPLKLAGCFKRILPPKLASCFKCDDQITKLLIRHVTSTYQYMVSHETGNRVYGYIYNTLKVSCTKVARILFLSTRSE